MAVNLPILFGELLVGGFLMYRGSKDVAVALGTSSGGSAGSPLSTGGVASQVTGSTYKGPLAPVLATIRHMESGNYSQPPNAGGASGAYQYIDSTWKSQATAAGFGKYADSPSYLAPPDVQDAVAAFNVKQIIGTYGSVDYVPLAWYYPAAIGNSALLHSVPDPGAGNTETPAQYQAAWLQEFRSLGGQG